jgi:hypothetical protein
MFQVLVSCPENDRSLGSKLVSMQIKLFTSELVVIVDIYIRFLLKVIEVPKQFSDFFFLTLSSKFIQFSSQIFFSLFLKCLIVSRLTSFRLTNLLWSGSCNHCI